MTCYSATCCTRSILFLAFFLGSTFYVLEKRSAIWFDDQKFAPLDTYETTEGPCPLPIIYLDGSLVGAFYLVDPSIVQSFLPKSMEPLTLPWPINKAIAGLFMFDYRNTSIGSYSEMGLTFQAKQKGSDASVFFYLCDMVANIYHLDFLLSICEQKTTGLYVSTLPVTTVAAKAAGREIWGYNKYVTEMSSTFQNNGLMTFDMQSEFTYELDSNGGSFLPTFTFAGLPFLTYTEHKDKRIMRTKVHVGHKASWGGSVKLKITGKGPTSNRMSQLKLEQLSPVAVFRTDTLRAHLPKGEYIDGKE